MVQNRPNINKYFHLCDSFCVFSPLPGKHPSSQSVIVAWAILTNVLYFLSPPPPSSLLLQTPSPLKSYFLPPLPLHSKAVYILERGKHYKSWSKSIECQTSLKDERDSPSSHFAYTVYPTTNSSMQNGSSVGKCIHRIVHIFAHLAPICMLSWCLLTKSTASERSQKLCVVGWVLLLEGRARNFLL